jgi:hypothetical protein
MLATSALSVGIDHPRVVRVMFFREPYTLVDFLQQAGRAARDSRVQAIIELCPSSDLTKVQPELREFIQTRDCRRSILQMHADGVPSACHGLPNACMCDRCEHGEDAMPLDMNLGTGDDARTGSVAEMVSAQLPPATINARRVQHSLVIQAIYDTIHRLRNSPCVLCILHHTLGEDGVCNCARQISSQEKEKMKVMLDSVRSNSSTHIPGLHTCTRCYMPQGSPMPGAMDRHIDAFGVDSERQCNGTTIMTEILYAIVTSSHLPPFIAARFKEQPNRVGYILWTPVNHPPFEQFDIGRMLLQLHLLVAGCLAHLEERPSSVTDLMRQEWFQQWIPQAVVTPAPTQEMFKIARVASQAESKRRRHGPGSDDRLVQFLKNLSSPFPV